MRILLSLFLAFLAACSSPEPEAVPEQQAGAEEDAPMPQAVPSEPTPPQEEAPETIEVHSDPALVQGRSCYTSWERTPKGLQPLTDPERIHCAESSGAWLWPLEAQVNDGYISSHAGAERCQPVVRNRLRGLERIGAFAKAHQLRMLEGITADMERRAKSLFGSRMEDARNCKIKPHTGMDMPAPQGSRVVAVYSGIVTKVGTEDACGNFVELQLYPQEDRVFAKYCHLSRIAVKAKANVQRGQLIAFSGGARGSKGAGSSTGPHLHLEVYMYETPIPESCLLLPGDYLVNPVCMPFDFAVRDAYDIRLLPQPPADGLRGLYAQRGRERNMSL